MNNYKNDIKSYDIQEIKSSTDINNDFAIFPFEYFMEDNDKLKLSHRHLFHGIIYTTSGSGSHTIDFINYPIEEHRVFFIKAGQVHAWNTLNHIKGYVILFSNQFYNLVYTGNDYLKSDVVFENLSTFIDINMNEQNSWMEVIRLIEDENDNHKKFKDETLCLYLKVLILKYSQQQQNNIDLENTNSRKLQLVNQYKELINLHYLTKKSPKEYAYELNITANYLNGVCNECLGKSASEIIKDRVVLEAKRLLSHTNLTVTQISYELGFEDKSHFGKYFKTHSNLTPNNFRKNFINL